MNHFPPWTSLFILTNITMDNFHFSWENPLFLWPFSYSTSPWRCSSSSPRGLLHRRAAGRSHWQGRDGRGGDRREDGTGGFFQPVGCWSWGKSWENHIWVWINTYENTIFRGMNIHLPAILMWTTGVQGFDTLPYGKPYGKPWNILGIDWIDWIDHHWKLAHVFRISMGFPWDFDGIYVVNLGGCGFQWNKNIMFVVLMGWRM